MNHTTDGYQTHWEGWCGSPVGFDNLEPSPRLMQQKRPLLHKWPRGGGYATKPGAGEGARYTPGTELEAPSAGRTVRSVTPVTAPSTSVMS